MNSKVNSNLVSKRNSSVFLLTQKKVFFVCIMHFFFHFELKFSE